MKSDFSLEDKIIWVIGGAGYLGTSIVKELLCRKSTVVCADIDQRSYTLANNLDCPENLIPVTLDVRNEKDIVVFARGHADSVGIPDGLVVLTYGASGKNLEEMSASDFDEAGHLGTTATFLLARTAGNIMKERGKGSIVLFSSMYGMVSPDPGIYKPPMNVNPIEYGVGKAGIIQMTKYLAVYWGKSGVRCNCISPGPFPNERVQGDHPGFVNRLAEKVPMGRVGLAHEIAGPALFLLSDQSSFVTGHNLVVDGGWTVR